jgi:CubicO group peptidase (beta-lactamase class C family)
VWEEIVVKAVEINGYCDPRFSAAKEAFRENFDSGLEVGASFAATINGKFVVDIWGGYADKAQTRPWGRDTIVNVYSTTKVMTAICALILIDRGQLDPDAPVAKYWPEFAQAGKDKIPVRYLLSHQSGVAGLDEPVPLEAIYDWNRMIDFLEKQKPWWEPGKYCGYHALTFGYLIGELVRRITGKSLGSFFHDEVAIPLGADFQIGFSAEHDYRVAELIPAPVLKPGEPGYVDMLPGSMGYKVMANPVISVPTVMKREYRRAEIPAINGHGNAHSVARVGASIACGGVLDGVNLIGTGTIVKALEEQIYSKDLLLNVPRRYGLGFGLNCNEEQVSPNPRTLWWGGMGGSKMVMDLDAKLSWGYVMNKMSADPKDMRGKSIAQTLYSSL